MPLPPIPRVHLRRLVPGEASLIPEVGTEQRSVVTRETIAEGGSIAPPLQDYLLCPNCGDAAPVAVAACPECGFPFSCDISLPSPVRQHRLESWRMALAMVALACFLLTGGLYRDSVSDYQGLTYELIGSLTQDTDSGILVDGSGAFVARTQLALGLLEQRTPDLYRRFQRSVERIQYLSPEILHGPLGRSINLEGIGAVATPSQRLIQVMPMTAFPSGEDANDRALFSYAATLVHELRHIELHWNAQAPGGVNEEVLCEEAALNFLQQAGAPTSLIADKQLYLAEPTHRRYQRWYDWYKQFD